MIKEDYKKIQELFTRNNLEWYVNISIEDSKSLEYSPLHDEVSLDNSQDITTSVVIIKDNRKWTFKIDWYSLEKIENSFKDILKVIDYSQKDKDIIVPEINDVVEKDFSNHKLQNIDFDFLKNEFSNFKNFNFDKKVKIETFSIGYKYSDHYYINSKWSFKLQKDNVWFYYFELFWENWEKREVHYKYKSIKDFPKVTNEEISQIQAELLDKISDEENTISAWTYNITLEKDVFTSFLDIILWNLSAEWIREWVSLFSKNKIWDKIFSDKFTIVNNPDLPWYTWTMLFDWEWVTAKKTTIFEAWVLKSKFYDYKNALKEWLENLWNSSISNIELVWEIDKDYLKKSDFLFTNLMAFHTVDSSTWKFALNWEWYLLKDWKKSWFVKNISLTWNIVDLFSNILSIWDDFKTDWNFKVPSVTFEKQSIV